MRAQTKSDNGCFLRRSHRKRSVPEDPAFDRRNVLNLVCSAQSRGAIDTAARWSHHIGREFACFEGRTTRLIKGGKNVRFVDGLMHAHGGRNDDVQFIRASLLRHDILNEITK